MGTTATIEERDDRLGRLRRSMEEAHLDALIIAAKGHWWTGRGYFRYLTDFHLWGHDALILLPLAGEAVATLNSSGVSAKVADRGWITDVRPDWDIAPRLIDAVVEKGLHHKRLGFVGRGFIMSAGTMEALVHGLPDARFIAADPVIDRVRAIKSALEIKQNYELWDLAKSAGERFLDVLASGGTEREISSEVLKVCYGGGARDHLVFYNREIPKDKAVTLEDIVAFHLELCNESGHWCELNATVAFRDPTLSELRKMESELMAYDEIRKAAKPGVRLSELAAVFTRVLLDCGWKMSADLVDQYDFHGHGMDVIEWPRFGPTETRFDTELISGMVFSYHPSRNMSPAVRETGVNEDLLITDQGGVRLCQGTSGISWGQQWRRG